MELSILEETPKRLVFEVKGQGHTLCNGLKSKLWENKHVKTATYIISHPLVGIPKMESITNLMYKHNLASYDAAFVTLADSKNIPLFTADYKHHQKSISKNIIWLKEWKGKF